MLNLKNFHVRYEHIQTHIEHTQKPKYTQSDGKITSILNSTENGDNMIARLFLISTLLFN